MHFFEILNTGVQSNFLSSTNLSYTLLIKNVYFSSYSLFVVMFWAQLEINDPEDTTQKYFSTKRCLYSVSQVSQILCSDFKGFLTSKRSVFGGLIDHLSKMTFVNLENFVKKIGFCKNKIGKKVDKRKVLFLLNIFDQGYRHVKKRKKFMNTLST